MTREDLVKGNRPYVIAGGAALFALALIAVIIGYRGSYVSADHGRKLAELHASQASEVAKAHERTLDACNVHVDQREALKEVQGSVARLALGVASLEKQLQKGSEEMWQIVGSTVPGASEVARPPSAAPRASPVIERRSGERRGRRGWFRNGKSSGAGTDPPKKVVK